MSTLGVPVCLMRVCLPVCAQVAKQAGRSLEFQKLSHNLAVLHRKKLGDIETAYEIYQVCSCAPCLFCQSEEFFNLSTALPAACNGFFPFCLCLLVLPPFTWAKLLDLL